MSWDCGAFPIRDTNISHAQEIRTGSDKHSSSNKLGIKGCPSLSFKAAFA